MPGGIQREQLEKKVFKVHPSERGLVLQQGVLLRWREEWPFTNEI